MKYCFMHGDFKDGKCPKCHPEKNGQTEPSEREKALNRLKDASTRMGMSNPNVEAIFEKAFKEIKKEN